MIVKHEAKVKSYTHDSLPRPYTGMGEDYEVYPGNKRTVRHQLELELDFEPEELELAQEIARRFNGLIEKINSRRG
jgi:hypothetical protein